VSCDSTKAATFHDGFPKRAKVKNRRTAAAFFANYALNLMLSQQSAETYIECNPALLEHIALTYGIRDALNAVPAGMLAQQARSLLVTRHPYTYVASMKARGWGWSWWQYPQAQAVHGIGDGYAGKSMLEQAAIAWKVKSRFYHTLTAYDSCMLLKFESLFDYRVTQERFTERIEKLFDHFGIVPIQGAGHWWRLRQEKIAPKNKAGAKLTSGEKQTVKAICGSMMGLTGYA
jgi:hypothetical protein